MTRKEKIAKRKALFSLKRYLLKKAQDKLAKLQHRAEKRENKGITSHNHDHDHTHEHDHEHEHHEESE